MSDPSRPSPGEITQLLEAASRGNNAAFDQLLPLVYDELKRIAEYRLRGEGVGHTLNTTALVHEAYFKLVDQTRVDWQSRPHFFAVASEVMRRILIDHARTRAARKRGLGRTALDLDDAAAVPIHDAMTDGQALELLALEEALRELETFNPDGFAIVKHKFFGGFSSREIAEFMGSSERTVERGWTIAKAWLRQRLGDDSLGGAASLLHSEPRSSA
jgi:RNA polymerase sigma-70 factor, ECF subfamily